MTESVNPEFEALLSYIKRSRGFDFTGYKRTSLTRRVNKRMQTLGIQGYSHYLDYLEVHPEEFNLLFNTLLINVTAFFRDRSNWDYLASDIVPQILASKQPDEPIRIWSAGCASGQEAYTLAMLMATVLGLEQFRDRVKIYATDVDEEALNQARYATYSEQELEEVLPEERELYFERSENGFTLRKDLRRSVIFGRHDLIQDAPISRIDLLACRNTLMYFNAETQARILARFHFALRDNGFLFLGKAEMLLTHAHSFTPVELKRRIFTKVPKLNLRDRLLIMAQTDNEEVSNPLTSYIRLREAAFDHGLPARLVVDAFGVLVCVNEHARLLFGITNKDVGRPLQDLEISYRPVELRSCIDQTNSDRHPVILRDIHWQSPQGEPMFLDVQVVSLTDERGNRLGTSVTFTDVTRSKRLQEELEHANQELEMAYEELQSTNEELETTNEELQSSNEELETTNEELQSTNEELETMNEELQSTNEEMQTVNDELQRRSLELNQTNAFLESILTSLRGGVVVVDRDLYIQIWNHRAEDFWGLRTEEALGQNFLNLDIGLPVERLRQPMRSCLIGEPNQACRLVLSAVNRRGRQFECQVSCNPLIGSQGQIQGVILLMEEQDS
jgi:two-component system, chemotaxis family, CheB/CheR fusion protein